MNEQLIRFHVVANSDTETDQQIKLQVRDAVLSGIQSDLSKIADISTAQEYIRENIPRIRKIVNKTLDDLGVDQKAVVTLCRESFDVRQYDTFTLPSGIYNSLRIVIGEGQGKNWWCVSYPSLCNSVTSQSFEAIAADSGFSQELIVSISGSENYRVRFFLLDLLGRMEITLH